MSEKKPQITADWLNILEDEFQKDYMRELKKFLIEEKNNYIIYPKGSQIFNSLNSTPFEKVKVVILGQDPYHGKNQAHGLCFSVNRGVPLPPSLQNIFQEIYNETGIQQPNHGDLSSWAEQGVLLLNTTLTVRANQARSHAGKGWEQFTDKIISILGIMKENLVFVLWGRDAKTKAALIDSQRHLILTSSHPSPYSANYGFLGCGHFIKINQHLKSTGQNPINWQLPS